MHAPKRYYEGNDESVLPRSIAGFEAFENAMCLDIAMGGSTNTILHLLAAAHKAKVNFTMKDIDRLSRRVPHLCKVAPSAQQYHMEDVHRAGGVMAILGELDRAELLNRDVSTVHAVNMEEALTLWDVRLTDDKKTPRFFSSRSPGGVPTQVAFSRQDKRWDSLDTDRESGCIVQATSILYKSLLTHMPVSSKCTTSDWMSCSLTLCSKHSGLL